MKYKYLTMILFLPLTILIGLFDTEKGFYRGFFGLDLEEKLVGLERAMSYVSLSFSHSSRPFIHTTRRSDSWKHQLNSQLLKRNERIYNH